MAGILKAQVQEISQSTEKKTELEIMREKKDKTTWRRSTGDKTGRRQGDAPEGAEGVLGSALKGRLPSRTLTCFVKWRAH